MGTPDELRHRRDRRAEDEPQRAAGDARQADGRPGASARLHDLDAGLEVESFKALTARRERERTYAAGAFLCR